MSIIDPPSIPQMEPTYGEAEVQAVADYLRSGGWLTEHVYTRSFESKLAAFVGAQHCIAVSNGTVSLVAILLAMGIGPGDEVIVPTFTMIATANAVKLAGATPVLVDVAEETLCLDVAQIAAAQTSRTKAVLVVTLNGRSPDLPAIADWCGRHGVAMIEDAAQSLGSRAGGRHLGTFGRAGSFSFSVHKIITTGQGGAIVTNDDALAERLRMIKDFGRREGGADVSEIVGYNFKFTDLQAVIGLEQINVLEERIKRKKVIFARYREMLEEVVGFVDTDLNETTPWFVDVLVERRAALRAHLVKDGIGTRMFYPPIHQQAAYAEYDPPRGGRSVINFPVAERVAAMGLWLPSSLKLTDEDIARVCRGIREFYGDAGI